jgi:B9 domain-containing protein 2
VSPLIPTFPSPLPFSPAQGWPRLLVQCWRLDTFGRLEVEGYGFVHVPPSPGVHELSCPTWRPLGTPAQEWAAFFVGGTPSLKSTSVLYAAASERYRLVTTSSGTVHVRVEVVMRNADLYGLEG